MKLSLKMLIALILIGVAAFIFLYEGGSITTPPVGSSEQSSISKDLKVVRFGMLPYGDHTYAIIGESKGWFRDVGIKLDYATIKVEEIVPQLKNSTRDVISTPPGILFAAFDNSPNLVNFVFGDLFQGYAVLGQPDNGFISFKEAVEKGHSKESALKQVIQQFKGRTFAYPSEAAIKPFIDLLLTKGGIGRSDFTALVLDDPLTVNAMRKKEADFQVGGVPSRIILEREGYKVLISSIDFALMAKPSADSIELASILQNGWATTREYYNREKETILRLASVNFRIMDFINSDTEAALAIHMPYLSQVSGQTFSEADGRVIYESLNPFFTFEQQDAWFNNKDSPLYYSYINGAILNSFIKDGIFKGKPPTVDDVIFADDVYRELTRLRDESKKLFVEIEMRGGGIVSSTAYLEAKQQFQNYNFLDSEMLARKVLAEQ